MFIKNDYVYQLITELISINSVYQLINCVYQLINCVYQLINCVYQLINCVYQKLLCISVDNGVNFDKQC